LDALAINAITDFLLAGEVFFCAGMTVQQRKAPFSAAWFWSLTMCLLGLAALVGGIDHGFVEARGLPRFFIQRANWIVLGATTFGLLMTTGAQFFSPPAQRRWLIVATGQFVVSSIVVMLVDDFRNVIANYLPVMTFLLVMNVGGLKSGKGSVPMIAGIVILFAASAAQGLRVDVFAPVDHNGLYHVLSMAAVVCLYAGGRRLRTTR
jgi:hypothetical protein